MTGSRRPGEEHGTGGVFAILSTGEIVARLLSFVAILLLTRALGVEAFGVVAFALATVTYAELAVDFGLGHLGQLEVARARRSIPDLVTAVVASRLGLAVAVGAGLLAFVRWASLPPGAAEVIAWLVLLLLPRAVALDWVLIGARRPGPVAWGTVAGEAVLAGGVALAVHGPDDLLLVPLVYLAARATRVVITGVSSLRRFGAPRPVPEVGLARELLHEAFPIGASTGCGLLLYPFDLMYVGIVVGAEASGLFGAGHRLYLLLGLLSMAYFRALRPDFGRASIDGYASIHRLVSSSLRVSVAVSLGVAIGGSILAEPLLEFFFGSGYGEAAGVLPALLVGFAVGTAVLHHRNLLVAFGHQRIDLVAGATVAGLNVVLDVAVVPAWGVVGAAWTTTLSICVLSMLVVPAVRRRVGPVPLGVPSLRTLVCGAILAGFLLAVDGPHVLVRIALGGIVYLGSVLAIGAIRIEDVRNLDGSVPGTEPPPERSDPARGTDSGSWTSGPETD